MRHIRHAMTNHLRTARERLGLTQAQVAAAIGRTQADVCKYENGTRPRDTQTLTKLAEVLQITREDVVFGPSPETEIGKAA